MATTLADENWQYLVKLLPSDWEQSARTSGAVRRRRGFDSIEQLLRGLLLHVGLGCSLRETVVVAKSAGWLNMSDVALLKKLRQSERWLQSLCLGLLRDSALEMPASSGLRMRLIDATHVKEPGQTGSQWRVHFSLRVPDWTCDHFEVTSSQGEGHGESLRHFPVRTHECLIADRGYAHASGIWHVAQKGGHVIVRHHPQALPMETEAGTALDLLPWLRSVSEPGQVASKSGYVRTAADKRVPVRVCVVRKSPEAIVASQRKVRRRAQRKGQQLLPQTLEYAQWVIVLTTVPAETLDDNQVLQWYRVRWQVELAFKRMKSLAGLGHLPKYDDSSSRAWLYGKLLIALLTDKMQRHAGAFSPWGLRWGEQDAPEESLARS